MSAWIWRNSSTWLIFSCKSSSISRRYSDRHFSSASPFSTSRTRRIFSFSNWIVFPLIKTNKTSSSVTTDKSKLIYNCVHLFVSGLYFVWMLRTAYLKIDMNSVGINASLRKLTECLSLPPIWHKSFVHPLPSFFVSFFLNLRFGF